jgi:hypothetical protein
MLLVLLLPWQAFGNIRDRSCFRDQNGRQHQISTKVIAKTMNHDLKALKRLFKIARKIAQSPRTLQKFVETVRKEKGAETKRPCKGYRGFESFPRRCIRTHFSQRRYLVEQPLVGQGVYLARGEREDDGKESRRFMSLRLVGETAQSAAIGI